LHQVLDGNDTQALRARTHLQQHLLLLSQQEIGRQDQDTADRSTAASMLTTQEAAALMGCSRPHVAMLIDTGCLDGAVRTPKGHRRVPLASVQQWLLEHPTVPPGTDTYRQAGQEAGIYAVSVADSAKAAARRTLD
jgi:excisionase family DNA binding protein